MSVLGINHLEVALSEQQAGLCLKVWDPGVDEA